MSIEPKRELKGIESVEYCIWVVNRTVSMAAKKNKTWAAQCQAHQIGLGLAMTRNILSPILEDDSKFKSGGIFGEVHKGEAILNKRK